MKILLFILRIILIAFLLFFLLKLGIRAFLPLIRFWYLSIPAAILLYHIIKRSWKNKISEQKNNETPFDPRKEVKPEKEPELSDWTPDDETDDNNTK